MKRSGSSLDTIPESPEQNHRRQSFWQIILPLTLTLALFLAAATLVVMFTAGYLPEIGLPDQQSPLAKSSVIFLITGPCLGSLVLFLVLIGSVVLIAKMTQGLPSLAHRVQRAFARTATLTKQVSEKLAAPVISIESSKAGVVHLLKYLGIWKNNPDQGS